MLERLFCCGKIYVTILLQVINKMLKVQERQNDAIRSSVHTQINQKFSQG